VKVTCEVPLPVTDGGANPTVTPSGRPVADRSTSDEKPPTVAIETVEFPLFPGITPSGGGGAIEKSGCAGPTVR